MNWKPAGKVIDGKWERPDPDDLPERTYHCPVCRDSGMETGLRCAGPSMCGPCADRGHRLYDHTYARKCSCRQTNPAYQKDIQRLQEQVGKRKAEGAQP